MRERVILVRTERWEGERWEEAKREGQRGSEPMPRGVGVSGKGTEGGGTRSTSHALMPPESIELPRRKPQAQQNRKLFPHITTHN